MRRIMKRGPFGFTGQINIRAFINQLAGDALMPICESGMQWRSTTDAVLTDRVEAPRQRLTYRKPLDAQKMRPNGAAESRQR